MLLAWAIAAASFAWVMLLVWTASPWAAAPVSLVVHHFASFVCHQELDRTFTWGATAWAVCARCLGLYLAAPAGAIAALVQGDRMREREPRAVLTLLAVTGAPTAATWAAEHLGGVAVGNGVRFAAALPLGAALAWVLVRTAIDARARGVSQYTLKDARRGPTR